MRNFVKDIKLPIIRLYQIEEYTKMHIEKIK